MDASECGADIPTYDDSENRPRNAHYSEGDLNLGFRITEVGDKIVCDPVLDASHDVVQTAEAQIDEDIVSVAEDGLQRLTERHLDANAACEAQLDLGQVRFLRLDGVGDELLHFEDFISRLLSFHINN
jgi:hypothetical protein